MRSLITEQMIDIIRERGVKCTQLSGMTGIHYDTLRRKLAGQRDFTVPEMESILDALGMALDIIPAEDDDDWYFEDWYDEEVADPRSDEEEDDPDAWFYDGFFDEEWPDGGEARLDEYTDLA